MPAHVNAMGQVLLAEFNTEELDDYFRNAKLEKVTRFTPTSEVAIRRALAGVAKAGFALSDQQLQLGLRSIAVPVPVRSGRTEVAINVSAGDHRVSKRELVRRFLPVLRRAAEQLAHAL
jgi:IclR family pca regulon transcriptional regulator